MEEPISKPKFQFSIRAMLLATACVAITFSTYRTAGPAAMCVMLKAGTLVGIFATLASRRVINRFSLAVFAGAIIGAAAVIQVVDYDPNAMYRRDLHASIFELIFGNEFGQQYAATPAMFGAFFGASVVTITLYVLPIFKRWLTTRDTKGESGRDD
jgi:hypothetical protein